jgi:hypothetical protein
MSSSLSNIGYVSESGSNYMKFSSGKLIQWGIQTVYTSSSTQTVTYPKAFSAKPAVTAGRVNTYSSSSGGRVTSIYSQPSTTSFSYYVYNQTEGGYFMWIAIGSC